MAEEANIPKTAEQINAPQMGQVRTPIVNPFPQPKVRFSKSDPVPATESAVMELTADGKFSLTLKLPRASLIEAVKNCREIPVVWQNVLMAEIEVIHPKHDLLRLDFIRHGHGAGSNFTGTVKEI